VFNAGTSAASPQFATFMPSYILHPCPDILSAVCSYLLLGSSGNDSSLTYSQLTELYELLSANYVEDDAASFRFKYSAEFLQWALMPPGWHKEWHVGVRVKSNQKLVAFIGGAPVTLRVRNAQFKSVEINFLVVHKKLRGKRLAPVLIKEVTRQCNLKGIFQAIYTAGVFLPTPVSVCRYYHRLLNVPKLIDVGFTGLKSGMTVARMVRLFKLPSAPALAARGLREMEDRDVPEVRAIFNQYMKKFGMQPVYNAEEVRHLFLSGRGHGDVRQGRREGQVVWAYVVEDPTTHKVTDFFSFYTLPSTVLGNARHGMLDAAYLFYYGTNVALQSGAEADGRLKARLNELVADALVVAEQAKFDVFNAMTLMDNDLFLSDLKVRLSKLSRLVQRWLMVCVAVRARRRSSQLLSVQLEDIGARRRRCRQRVRERTRCWHRHALSRWRLNTQRLYI